MSKYDEVTKNGIDSIETLFAAMWAAAKDEDGGDELEGRFIDWLEALTEIRKQHRELTRYRDMYRNACGSYFSDLCSYREKFREVATILDQCVGMNVRMAALAVSGTGPFFRMARCFGRADHLSSTISLWPTRFPL